MVLLVTSSSSVSYTEEILQILIQWQSYLPAWYCYASSLYIH